jgi:FdhD protein
VALRGEPASLPAQRRFVASASCGTCGKASVEDLEVAGPPLGPGPVVPRSVLVELPDRLREAQRLFDRTGGLHAAGRFTATGEARAVSPPCRRPRASPCRPPGDGG